MTYVHALLPEEPAGQRVKGKEDKDGEDKGSNRNIEST